MILILTDPAVGGTFLAWSLHWLAGHKTYFHARLAQWSVLPTDPILNTNAHSFIANQAVCINDVCDITEQLGRIKTDQFHHLYFHNLQDQPSALTGLHQPTADVISKVQPKFNHTVLLDNQNPLYHAAFVPRVLTRNFCQPNTDATSADEQYADFVQHFFGDSMAFWQRSGLKDVWDQREFLALNLRPWDQQKMVVNVDLVVPHFYLNTVDLHNTFDQTVPNLFDFLGLKISSTNFDHWQGIYSNWKRLHLNRWMFCWHFDEIIDSVIHGYDMDLSRFCLDLIQEACIQHHLIYNHDLNFQTFNLAKFHNTKQLHRLLEKNIHPLTDY